MNRITAVLLFGVILILVVLVQFKSDLEEDQDVTLKVTPHKSAPQEIEENAFEQDSKFDRQVASSTKLNEGIFIDEKLHPLCLFQKLSKQKFSSADIKKFSSHLGASEPEAKDKIFVMVINDSRCSDGNFRIIRAAFHQKAGWVVEKDIDCVNTSLEEQVAYGITIQGEIIEVAPEENFIHLAINGDGFFQLKCQGSHFLSRDGTFYLDRLGYLKNVYGCNVLNKEELPVRAESSVLRVNEKGCFANGNCFQIVPFSYLEKLKNFKVNTSLGMIELNAQNKLPSLARPNIVDGALEDQKYSLLIKNSRYAEADIWENPPEKLDCEEKK